MSIEWLEPRDARILDPAADIVIDVRTEEAQARLPLPGARRFDPGVLRLDDTGAVAVAAFLHTVESHLRLLGADARQRIVVLAQGFDTRASRLLWALEFAGHTQVAVLDSQALDGPAPWLHQPAPVRAGDFRAQARHDLLARVEDLPSADLLLDARRLADYREGERDASGAPHLPGALHFDADLVLDAQGRLLDAATLRERLAAAGVNTGAQIVTYCGGGGRATQLHYALQQAGIASRVYLPGWTGWRARASHPAHDSGLAATH